MATFNFFSITSDQASAFSAADILDFDTAAATPAVGSAVSVTVILTDTGAALTGADRTVNLGSGFLGRNASVFKDGSRLFAGGAGGESSTGTALADQLLGGGGADTLSGAAGNDLLDGGSGEDSILGGDGDDVVQGGAGGDTLNGGAGFDLLSYASATSGLNLSFLVNSGAEASDSVSGFEGLEGGAFADQLTGDASGNLLRGGGGDDTLIGAAGDDSLQAGRGDDLVDGGDGIDTLVYGPEVTGGVFATLEINRSISFDNVQGADRIVGIENVSATRFDDAVNGDGGSNVLRGLGGRDSISALGGADTVEGGDGADSLSGGDGDDRLTGGLGADVLAGGGGADIFEFGGADDSPTTGFVTLLDRITDFSAEDVLLFRGGAAPTAANVMSFFTIGFIDARDRAAELFAQGVHYVAAQVGGSVFVFTASGPGAQLDGVTAADITVRNFSNNAGLTLNSNAPTAGADSLVGGAGVDTISGGAGGDTINGGEGVSYLRGDDGDDSLLGGSAFDDINGNMGADTVATGAGEDFCVGGKDNDSLSGGADYDLVYGNLGDDTCLGDGGNDIIRGGQGNDTLSGGDGNDFVSGDRGDDTMVGGAGADIFHSSGDAGVDRVLDFSLAQGDRVQLDAGTTFTVAQVGGDTVIQMSAGQVILVGVTMSTLPPGTIFGA